MKESIEALEDQYREFAEAHRAATEHSDPKNANENHDKLIELLLKIRAHGSEGETALLRLIQDENEAVACWSATHSLPFAEAIALQALERFSIRPGPVGFDARMVIKQWEKGMLVLP